MPSFVLYVIFNSKWRQIKGSKKTIQAPRHLLHPNPINKRAKMALYRSRVYQTSGWGHFLFEQVTLILPMKFRVNCLSVPEKRFEINFQDGHFGFSIRTNLDIFYPQITPILPIKSITKTYLYNFDPLKPHFYIVKLGFTGVYIIFLNSAQRHRL